MAESYFDRKEKLVFKEFETGFSSYQKVEGKVSSLRQWTITINVAFVLFIVEKDTKMLLPTIFIFLLMFIILVLELRERASMAFDKANILELEQIFELQNEIKYEKEICDYKFRDQRISKLNAKTKLSHYIKSVFKGEVAVWYGMWILLWTLLISIKRWTWIISDNYPYIKYIYAVYILFLLCFSLIFLFKYFNLKTIFQIIKSTIKKSFVFKKRKRKPKN